MLQFLITYYFTSSDTQAELSAAILYLLSLIEEGTNEGCSAEVQLILLENVHMALDGSR
jgi:hypothetical protein